MDKVIYGMRMVKINAAVDELSKKASEEDISQMHYALNKASKHNAESHLIVLEGFLLDMASKYKIRASIKEIFEKEC